jgi:dimethylamine/trimethylamine dehydrogenase
VCIATGSHWRRDGVARFHLKPLSLGNMPISTPDDLMVGKMPSGHVLIYDDDHYYMGGVLAELLTKHGCKVTLVTPSTKASEWSYNTLEQGIIQQRLLMNSVDIRVTRALMHADGGQASISCTYTGREETLACDALVLVTARLPNQTLYEELQKRKTEWLDAGIETVSVIGDAEAPSSAIAWSTYAGHRYAEELDEPRTGGVSFRREIAELLD